MKLPDIWIVKNGIRYDTKIATILAHGQEREQTTYLLRGNDGRYFAAYHGPTVDFIKPMDREEAQALYNYLPAKKVDFDTVSEVICHLTKCVEGRRSRR